MDELEVGRFRFGGVAGEPLLLWDAPLAAGVEDIGEFFGGNVERYQQPRTRVIDTTAMQPLADSEFWPIIGALEKRTWENTIRKAVRLIADQGELFAMRWAQTSALKALVLADALENADWATGDELHVIGATLAQGEEAYSTVLSDTARFNPRWLSDLASQTIWLGSHAMDRVSEPDMRISVETTFTPRHREILERTDAETARWQREHGISPSEPGLFMRAARAVVNVAGNHRERVILIVDAENSLVEGSRVVEIVESFGGAVVAGPEFSTDGGLGSCFDGEVFTVKRRSTASVADYLARHASVPE